MLRSFLHAHDDDDDGLIKSLQIVLLLLILELVQVLCNRQRTSVLHKNSNACFWLQINTCVHLSNGAAKLQNASAVRSSNNPEVPSIFGRSYVPTSYHKYKVWPHRGTAALRVQVEVLFLMGLGCEDRSVLPTLWRVYTAPTLMESRGSVPRLEQGVTSGA